ncbi:MAG: DUF192 domain-containing protein [Candidatus Aureabacteria bacterium]|nr:DUF192 domain-containing protein [Candidatus Auribacterota bacterium]
MVRKILAVWPAVLALCISSCSRDPAPLSLARAAIRVGDRVVSVELARRPGEQDRGLMFRKRLREDEGMLFIYDSPRVMSFWMKNTRIPLSIAFVDAGGKIVHIEDMHPYDSETRHVCPVPAQYALEMNQGWFQRNGVGVGQKMEIPNSKS